MRRTSNLGINRAAFTADDLPDGCKIEIRRDRKNIYDVDAVGVFLDNIDDAAGWLYRKDNNRLVVLDKLDAGGKIEGQIEQAADGKCVVIYWL